MEHTGYIRIERKKIPFYLKDKKVIGAIVSSRHPSNDGTYRKAKQTLEKSLSSKIKSFRIEKKNKEMTYDPINDKVIWGHRQFEIQIVDYWDVP